MRIPDDINLPEDISDEAAYELYELLEGLFMAVEERYHHRIRRYLQSCARERRMMGTDDDDIGF